jgi:hypothetical protein
MWKITMIATWMTCSFIIITSWLYIIKFNLPFPRQLIYYHSSYLHYWPIGHLVQSGKKVNVKWKITLCHKLYADYLEIALDLFVDNMDNVFHFSTISMIYLLWYQIAKTYLSHFWFLPMLKLCNKTANLPLAVWPPLVRIISQFFTYCSHAHIYQPGL